MARLTDRRQLTDRWSKSRVTPKLPPKAATAGLSVHLGDFFMASETKPNFLLAFLVGGLVSGVIDIFTAIFTFHMTPEMFGRLLSAGWLGREAVKGGGPQIMALGFASHLGIAVIDALIFCFFAARVPEMRRHWLVAGLVFGLCVYAVMNAIVIPFSALGPSKAPFNPTMTIINILEHMTLFALPIAYSARRFLGKPA